MLTCLLLCDFRFLDGSPDGTVYIVMCLVVRAFQGVGAGAGAFLTASFSIIAYTFPKNIGATFVSIFKVMNTLIEYVAHTLALFNELEKSENFGLIQTSCAQYFSKLPQTF